MKESHKRLYRTVGRSAFSQFWLSMVGQFAVSITQGQYHNLRLMFIEKMGLG